MIDWKTIGKNLLYPPVWLMILLAVFSTAALVAIFVAGWEQTAVAYIVYVLSAYTLTAWCFFCIKVLPGTYRNAKDKVYAHPVGNRYMTDVGYKVRVSLYLSLGINLLYAAFNLIAGAFYDSPWMVAVAVYYVLLSGLRFTLLRYMRADKDNAKQNLTAEYRRYRFTGVLMLLINLMLSAVVLHSMVDDGKSFSQVTVIALAAFTFYMVAMSVKDMIKYRRYERPVVTAAKAIRLTASMVSLLSLEISMLKTFGDDATLSRTIIMVTGACICVLVISMSVYMIVHANKELKKQK